MELSLPQADSKRAGLSVRTRDGCAQPGRSSLCPDGGLVIDYKLIMQTAAVYAQSEKEDNWEVERK